MLLGIKQVLINIDEDKYEHICQKVRKAKNEDRYVHYEWEIIANGIVFPKGHGRLIDADELYGDFIDGTEGYDCNTWNRIEIGDIIEDVPTIIEAEGSDSE